MNDRERELQALIASQRADMRAGTYQRPEDGTVPYGFLIDIVDASGVRVSDKRLRRYDSCAIHGNAETRLDPNKGTGFACRACEREDKRMRRATSAEQRRKDVERVQRWRAKVKGEE